MAISYDSERKTKALAPIQAELDRINRNFVRSFRMCNEVAKPLLLGANQKFNDTQHSRLKQACSLFRGIPT